MAGIYVHIPLCASKCAYCDFYSIPRGRISCDELVESLLSEYRCRKKELSDEPIKTLYLGGGTPSSLPPHLLTQLINNLKTDDTEEITVEINPEDVNDVLAETMSDAGVNRVSMGVQSLIDSELEFIGRRHSAAKAIEAVATLRKGGINNISLDLIYGLPGQTLDSWERSVDGIMNLSPQHLSAYLLSYEKGTRLYAMLKSGKIAEATDDRALEMYGLLCKKTRDAGFNHYEISNFAQPGFTSRHNSAYWDGTPYLGLGPGAHSLTLGIRRANPPKISEYISAKGLGLTINEEETTSERYNDFIMTSLRTSSGIKLDVAERRFGRSAEIRRIAKKYIQSGAMIESENSLRIAESSWLIADSIILDFIEV